MRLQYTDRTTEGKGDGSCDKCLWRAAAALIHAGVVERCAIRFDRYRDFRRLAGAVSVTVCRMLNMSVTVCGMLNMSTARHVSTGHTG